MTLKQIEYFQMVCVKGNISAAADELFISRSVISRALAELESEFGAQLFDRSKSGVRLTENGQIIARLFEEFKFCYIASKERISQRSECKENASLRLGITPTNAYRVYQRYLGVFRRENPNTLLLISEYSANDAGELLLNGDIDAFFTPARMQERNIFDSLNLYKTQIALGAADGTPITRKTSLGISDILDLPLGYLNAPMPVEGIMKSCFESFGKTPSVVIRTSDQLLLRELTLHGIVYPILPDDMLKPWEGVKSIPLNFFPPSTHRLVWNKALPHDSVFYTFLDFMSQYSG